MGLFKGRNFGKQLSGSSKAANGWRNPHPAPTTVQPRAEDDPAAPTVRVHMLFLIHFEVTVPADTPRN